MMIQSGTPDGLRSQVPVVQNKMSRTTAGNAGQRR